MMKKLELTPSRSLNYRQGQAHMGDRYVSLRSEKQLELANHLLTSENSALNKESPASRREREAKLRTMRVSEVNEENQEDKVCAFRKGFAPKAALGPSQNVLYSCIKPSGSVKRSRRYIAKSPERILDAPGILDDFYLSLTDWSSSNTVAVGLGNTIYVWDADKGDADVLTEVESEAHPTLLKWSQEGRFLAIGLSDGSLKIYDVNRSQCVRTLNVQMNGIGCGCWRKNGILSYGTYSGRIYHHDVRIQQSLVGLFENHSQKVCGLKWSEDERYMTSGGADCLVNVWEQTEIMSEEPNVLWSFSDHCATVKAIEYVPFLGFAGSNMVATGGGTNDHTVRIWNLATGTIHSIHDTFSQVSGILFNKHYREMITGHGNPNPGVRLWHYQVTGSDKQSFLHVADMKGHGGRVLGLCQNPDGSFIMSLAADETMRFWNCWKVDESLKDTLGNAPSSSLALQNRKKLGSIMNTQNIR